MKQSTLRTSVTIDGVGVHGGKPSRLTLHPAEAGSGYTFLRSGLPDGGYGLIDARHTSVKATALCTVVEGEGGASVSTVEHVLAALAGMGVDNAVIEVNSGEMPIMDGSSAAFVEEIRRAGLRRLSAPRKVVKVLRPVSVSLGRAHAELVPASSGLRFDVEIDFENPVIGRQRRVFDLGADEFEREIASARTFGFLADAEKLRGMGFARGSSLDNTIVVDEDSVLNPDGLRFGDEFVRHKILDAVGDLALAGSTIEGAYRAYCPGHKLNFMMLDALFADRANYAIVEPEQSPARAARVEMAAIALAPDRS
jgi:UDP-3-O-[3-hydroxymyristoyl] N-acetylglucosamine deacetylase